MIQHGHPEAPVPPPPPQGAMHPGTQQLPVEMDRLNLQHGMLHYSSQGNSHPPSLEERYKAHGHAVDPHLPYLDHAQVPITYEGWNFVKQAPSRANEKATWSLVVKNRMPMSQTELRDEVAKQRRKGKSVTEQYNAPDMKGFKKKQVERLIADKLRMETDPRFDYKLGALKLDQKRTKNGWQTDSMQVILKRVFRTGAEQPLGSGRARAEEMEGEIVDLTGADDLAYSQSSHSTDPRGQYVAHPHPGYIHAQPYDEHAAYYPDHGPGVQVIHHQEAMLPMPHHGPGVQAIHPQEAMLPMPHQPEQYMQPHEAHHEQQTQHPLDYHTREHQTQHHHDHKDKKDKKKDQKPEVHQKREKKAKKYYDSSSDSPSDDGSSLYTDQTPDTEYSGHSGHPYHKEKHSSSRKSSRRDSRSLDHDLSPVRQVYRERHRKSSARSLHGGQEYDVVETVITDGHHDQPYNTTYIKDRPFHQRALSYDDDRSSRPVHRQRRLNSYAHPIVDEHPQEEKERLKWEVEGLMRQRSEERREKARVEFEERRQRERIEADRLERQKLELERERLESERQRLESQKERDRLERARLENERYDREQYNRSDRERYNRTDRERYDRDDRERYHRDDRSRYDPFVDREPPHRYSTAFDIRRDDSYYR